MGFWTCSTPVCCLYIDALFCLFRSKLDIYRTKITRNEKRPNFCLQTAKLPHLIDGHLSCVHAHTCHPILLTLGCLINISFPIEKRSGAGNLMVLLTGLPVKVNHIHLKVKTPRTDHFYQKSSESLLPYIFSRETLLCYSPTENIWE